MDIHRCRFVPFPPSAINALAFSHSSDPNRESLTPLGLRLAIGRANGDIEIWNPLRGLWFHETTFKGGKDRSIDGLVWTQDPDRVDSNGDTVEGKLRLFSIGFSTYVTEWHLETGVPLRHLGGNHGEVWCLAAQPRWASPLHRKKSHVEIPKTESNYRCQDLAVGCADGAIILLSTDEGELRFKRSLSRASKKKARILSITFQSRSVIVAGCADSMIRIFDVASGQVIRHMSLGPGPRGGPREILVWTVKCLPNGNIISGDSLGELRFWDGKTYSLLQRVKSHNADVLDIETSARGDTVVSGGMDRRSIFYRCQDGGTGKKALRWAAVLHKRLHAHDVKALAAYEAGDMSVVVSGEGLDTNPIIVPLRQFGHENHRTLSSLPRHPQIQSAPSGRLIMSWWNREIWMWRFNCAIGITSEVQNGVEFGNTESRTLVAKIGLQGEENITSASLAIDGSLLAVATVSTVKLFRLRKRSADDQGRLRVLKVSTPEPLATSGARLVHFSPNAKWLCFITLDNQVRVARLIEDVISTQKAIEEFNEVSTLPRLDRHISQPSHSNCLGDYERGITNVAFSADSSILIVSDLAGYLDSWVIENSDDCCQGSTTLQDGTDSQSASSPASTSQEMMTVGNNSLNEQRWIRNPSASLFPKLPSSPVLLSFRPSQGMGNPQTSNMDPTVPQARHNLHPHSHKVTNIEDRLLAVTAQQQVFEFEVLRGALSSWSRSNPPSSLPNDFQRLMGLAMGCLWDVQAEHERLWLYGANWLCMLDLSRNMLSKSQRENKRSKESSLVRTKRKRGKGGNPDRHPSKILASSAGGDIPSTTPSMGKLVQKRTDDSNGSGVERSLPDEGGSSETLKPDDMKDHSSQQHQQALQTRVVKHEAQAFGSHRNIALY
ncbi:MAG: U3 small nucleolar RNA-associated protein [Piccolia ochrophora]|nr:MAG: U3 small nucleolar RNA-associated protein [Piccolia ochrophora]